MWNIEKHLIIGLVFDTASVNAGIHREVTACLEKASGSFLLLACRHPVLELLCGAAASFVYNRAKSPNEDLLAVFPAIKNCHQYF